MTRIGQLMLLWPGTETERLARVVGADGHGWRFRVAQRAGCCAGTEIGYRPGDQIYVSHSCPLTMVVMKEGE